MGEIKITNKNYTDGALHNHYRATRALRLGLVPEYHIPIHFYIRCHRRVKGSKTGQGKRPLVRLPYPFLKCIDAFLISAQLYSTMYLPS